MEGSLRKELYSESLDLSGVESALKLNPDSPHGHEDRGWENEDGSLWGDLEDDDNRDGVSDLDREWQRRFDQFHTIGFRDGVTAGQQAIAQEGFNEGFKQSVVVGYNWGIVRGITSALSCLPDGLKEKLIETVEKRDKFQSLYKSTQSVSADDALKLFHDDLIIANADGDVANGRKSVELRTDASPDSKYSSLDNYTRELQSLVHECPAINSSLLSK